MCWCNPSLRTPNCGQMDCQPPVSVVLNNATEQELEEALLKKRRHKNADRFDKIDALILEEQALRRQRQRICAEALKLKVDEKDCQYQNHNQGYPCRYCNFA